VPEARMGRIAQYQFVGGLHHYQWVRWANIRTARIGEEAQDGATSLIRRTGLETSRSLDMADTLARRVALEGVDP
jgi:hypothetical protein